ncbi:GLUG motif-containing protein [Psychromonas ossibalaenae]|uniref:GLUG motif-containing protein n=1 Tax=Psychromonas ossibalaenae TaxID=444922 RepID=UPI000367554E|nr:GLUG motif-containing protein [Psychromonas ossibalaenae]
MKKILFITMFAAPLLSFPAAAETDSSIHIVNNSTSLIHGAFQSEIMSGIAADSVNPAIASGLFHNYTSEDGYLQSSSVNIQEGDLISKVGVFDIERQKYLICAENVTFTGVNQYSYDGTSCVITEPVIEITSCKDLESIGKGADYPGASHSDTWPLNENYRLKNDIDCSATNPDHEDHGSSLETTYGENGFDSIKDEQEEFSGTLDGNGYSINNLYQRSEWEGGIFYRLHKDSIIKNLTINSAQIEAYFLSGILTPSADGKIIKAEVSGILTAHNHEGDVAPYGGIAGQLEGTIANSHADIKISAGAGSQAGGLVGSLKGNIINSSATGEIKNAQSIGGLVGQASENSSVINSFSTRMLLTPTDTQASTAAGLVGISFSPRIENTYAGQITINIRQNARGSGLIGTINLNDNVAASNSYAAGTITGSPDSDKNIAGGLATYSISSAVFESSFSSINMRADRALPLSKYSNFNSYYNEDKKHHGDIVGEPADSVSSDDLKTSDWYKVILNWSEDNWLFKDGYYPLLKDTNGEILDHQTPVAI